jgi:large subunit ribosomal protein L10
MSRKLKETMVQEMSERFSEVRRRGCVVVGFQGLDGTQAVRFRRRLSERGGRMTVVRNRLLAISLQQLGVPEIESLLQGPSAVITAEDPVQAFKAVTEIMGETPGITLRGGYADGRVLDAGSVQKIAKLPDRQTLLTQLVTCMVAPAQRLAGCFNAVPAQLASVLSQVKESKEKESPGS